MPQYEFECKYGHRTLEILSIAEFNNLPCSGPNQTEAIACPQCRKSKIAARTDGRIVKAVLVPSVTGTPKFKAGGAGGFYKSNA